MAIDSDSKERRLDYEKRSAVAEAIDLHQRGHLKESLNLLIQHNVSNSVIIRTLLNEVNSQN